MITLFEEFLLERKQLGMIYHFTHSLWGVTCILGEDELRSGGEFEGISFTRNKNMWNIKYYKTCDDNDRYKIRISFDGDRMSDRWKFEPFLYDNDFDFKDEAEERVLLDKMVGIRKYITKITFRRSSLERGDITKIGKLKKQYPEIKFEIIDDKISEGQQYLSDVEFKEEQDEDRIEITANKSGDEVGRIVLELNSGSYWYFEDDFTEDEYNEMFPEDEFIKIEHIEVRDKKSGVARKLMILAIEKSKELGYHQIYLNASPMNSENMLQLQDLVWFYKTFGFKEILHQGNNCQMLLNI